MVYDNSMSIKHLLPIQVLEKSLFLYSLIRFIEVGQFEFSSSENPILKSLSIGKLNIIQVDFMKYGFSIIQKFD